MIKNKLYTGLAALTTAVALTACSADEMDSSSGNPLNGDVISLTSRVAKTRAASELQTNALNTATKVGVFGINGTSAVTNGGNNQYSVTATGDLTADDKEMKWPVDGTAKVDIYAYAPYQSGWTAYDAANAFSVSADQSTDAGYLASDLLYASTKEVSKTSSAVVLAFSHKLVRINVKLTKGDDCPYDVSKSAISISGTKLATTLNPSTGALGAASGDAADIKIGADVAITADGTTTYGVVVPQQLAAGTQFVKIVADGKILSAKLASAVTLEAGKAYNFSAEIGSSSEVALSLGSVTLTGWGTNNELEAGDVEEVKYEYSPTSFVALGGGQNATYAESTYTWTASTNNLMTILEFPADGHKLSDFETLEITVSNLSDGAQWRVGYVPEGGSYTNFPGSPSTANGKLTIDLTALSGLSTATKIQLGGSSNASSEDAKSLKISPSDVVLKGLVSSTSDEETPSTSGTLTATFGTPGGNATYASPTYSWTATNNNLMTCFEFSNGELDNYKTLTFKLSNLSGNMVRMGYYVGSAFTEFGNGYGSNGTKTVDLTTLGIDLKTVTKIAFGGRTGTGSVDILASEVVLSK